MLLLISDACVIIDIEKGGLTNVMFSLPYQFGTPDILYNDELKARHAHLLNCGLICKSMDGGLIEKAYHLGQLHKKLSLYDRLALTLAQAENCTLLTGDSALRQIAESSNVEVHGTIWLVEQMLNNKKISVAVAHESFEKMLNADSRLPRKDIEKLLKKNNTSCNYVIA